MRKLIQIGDLAKRAGISPRTVKYYEELGLIEPASRSAGGFRYFSEDDLNRILVIKQLQLLDYPLSQIKELFSIRHQSQCGMDAAPIVLGKLNKQSKDIDDKLQMYYVLKEEIEKTKQLVRECFSCSLKPNKENCSRCEVLLSKPSIPLPFKAIL